MIARIRALLASAQRAPGVSAQQHADAVAACERETAGEHWRAESERERARIVAHREPPVEQYQTYVVDSDVRVQLLASGDREHCERVLSNWVSQHRSQGLMPRTIVLAHVIETHELW